MDNRRGRLGYILTEDFGAYQISVQPDQLDAAVAVVTEAAEAAGDPTVSGQ